MAGEQHTPVALRGLSNADDIEAAYREFPDETAPGEHPAGTITVNRGAERYAFLRGVHHARTAGAPA